MRMRWLLLLLSVRVCMGQLERGGRGRGLQSVTVIATAWAVHQEGYATLTLPATSRALDMTLHHIYETSR